MERRYGKVGILALGACFDVQYYIGLIDGHQQLKGPTPVTGSLATMLAWLGGSTVSTLNG